MKETEEEFCGDLPDGNFYGCRLKKGHREWHTDYHTSWQDKPVVYYEGQKYCHPRDRKTEWILIFEDVERGMMVFDNENSAREAYATANQNWNCTLFSPTPI